MAHGMRQDHSSVELPLNMNGNDELIAGAAWIAGKAILPMESESLKPKMPDEKQRGKCETVGYLN